MAIRQVLSAQKISFLLRGGVRVLVAMRDEDTGERLAWPRPRRGASGDARRCGGEKGPAPAHTLLLAEGPLVTTRADPRPRRPLGRWGVELLL